MRLLIDTQIFIWAVIDSDHLSEHARRIMLDAAEVFVSAASIWEIAIKLLTADKQLAQYSELIMTVS
jgi:PIN domain nuclease of toxin-antitoxin system